MTRVTYGVADSSHHVIGSLECANLEEFVDDILTGVNSVGEAKELHNDLIQALKLAKL